MKSAACAVLIVVLAIAPRPAGAAGKEDSSLLSLDIGAAFPMTQVDTGFGQTIAGKMGPALGIGWLYNFNEYLGAGARLAYFAFGSGAKTGNAGVNLKSSSTQLIAQATGRVDVPEISELPYIVTGLGFSQYKAKVKGTPSAFPWPGSGTSEPRTLVDRNYIGFVISFGAGYDFPAGKTSRGSIDLMWNDAQVESTSGKGYSVTFLFHWMFTLD